MNMKNILRITGFVILLGLWSCIVSAQDVSQGQIKGLDEQVQEIKSDIIAIAVELNQLEEKLLYPSHTQISIFIAIAADETFRLDAVEIVLDGKPVAHHLYSFKELEALQMGGVQRIFTGNVSIGEHELRVSINGKSENGKYIETVEQHSFHKDIGPGIVEITYAHQSISFNDR